MVQIKWNACQSWIFKFQAILVKKNAKIKYSYPLNINDLKINSENSVNSAVIYNKASKHLIAIRRKQKFMELLY